MASDALSMQSTKSAKTGQRRTRSSTRIGDIGEYYAVTWLWDNGYEVFTNAGNNGPVDIVALSPEGEVTLIDVKSTAGYKPSARTPVQKKLKVKYLIFNPDTRKLRFMEHRHDI